MWKGVNWVGPRSSFGGGGGGGDHRKVGFMKGLRVGVGEAQ